MKKIFTTIILALTITISCKAQLNNLNETELMYGIKFNNITLKNITVSNGNLYQIKSFFGNDIQQEINNTSPSLSKDFYNNIYPWVLKINPIQEIIIIYPVFMY